MEPQSSLLKWKRERHCKDMDGTVVSVDWLDFLLLGLGQPVLLGLAFRTLDTFFYILLVSECWLS